MSAARRQTFPAAYQRRSRLRPGHRVGHLGQRKRKEKSRKGHGVRKNQRGEAASPRAMGQRHEGTKDAWKGSSTRTLWGGATAGSPAIYPGRNCVLRRIGGPIGFRERGDDRPDGLFDWQRSSRRKRGSRSPGHTVIVRNLP